MLVECSHSPPTESSRGYGPKLAILDRPSYMAVSISKERLGGRHVMGEFCARPQIEMSLLSPAKDGQRWWAAIGSQKKGQATCLVSGRSALPILWSQLCLPHPQLPKHMAVFHDRQTTGHGFSLHPPSFSGAIVRLQRHLSRYPWIPWAARAGSFSVDGLLIPIPSPLRRAQPQAVSSSSPFTFLTASHSPPPPPVPLLLPLSQRDLEARFPHDGGQC